MLVNGSAVSEGRLVNVRLPNDSLSLLQVVEYIRSFLFGRAGLSVLNSLLIISGTFSMFQKKTVLAARGYKTSIVTEDMELVVRLHKYLRDKKQKCRITFVPDPICWTEAPKDLEMLKKQRRRWRLGLAGSIFMYRSMLFNYRYGRIGLFALPYQLLKELSTILSSEPGNADALALEKRLRQDRGPFAKAVYLNASDSDRNRIESYQASFIDTFGIAGHRFEFGYKRFEISLPGRSAAASFLDLKDSIVVEVISLMDPESMVESALVAEEKKLVSSKGLRFQNYPMDFQDMNGQKSMAGLAQAIERLSKRGGEKFYVHCYLGRHRAGLIEAALKKSSPPQAL